MKIMVPKGVCPPKDGTILLARVIPLLNGESKLPPKHQRATLPYMPLLPDIPQLLPLFPGILRLHFLTLLSRSLLALSWDHLVIIPIG